MTSAVVLLVALAALTGEPARRARVGTLFGFARGLGVLPGARLTTPGQARRVPRALRRPRRASRQLRDRASQLVAAVAVACRLRSRWAPCGAASRRDRQLARPLGGSSAQMRRGLIGASNERRVGAPVRGLDVDVELDLVAVRVEQVQAVGDGVVARADDLDPGRPAAPRARRAARRRCHRSSGRCGTSRPAGPPGSGSRRGRPR